MEGLTTALSTSPVRPPGPKNTRPFLGILPKFRKDPAGYLLSVAREYGDLAYMRLGPQHAFVVSHPDSIRDILVTNQSNFTKSRMLERAKVLLGDGLLTSESEFHTRQLPFSDWIQKLRIPPVRRFEKARDKLDRIVYGLIAERRASGKDAGDLLSMLLLAQDEEDHAGMTDKQVRDEALTLLIAGHETTANALTWTWYLLSQNPEVETCMRAELDRVLGGRPPAFD